MNHYTRPWGLRFNTPQKASFSHKGQIGILWLGKNAYLRWFVERTPNGWFMIGFTVLAHDFLRQNHTCFGCKSSKFRPYKSCTKHSKMPIPSPKVWSKPSPNRWNFEAKYHKNLADKILCSCSSDFQPSVYFPAQTSHRMLDLLLSNWNNCVWKWELGPNLAIWGWLGW